MEFVELIKTPKVDGVVLHYPFRASVEGTLCLTGHHLILSSRKTNSEELWLLHSNIDSIEKKFVGSIGYLTIKCKDFKIIHLDIPGMEECLNIASSIEVLSSLETITLTYPFFFRPMFDVMEDGWQAFLPENEFARLLGEEWRLSHVNKNFDVCPSYPQTVIVPKSIDDGTLEMSARFRHGGRFPVLSYHHSANGMVMMRCGQPLTGPNNKRCKDDERLVNAVLSIGKRGYIIDTRSPSVAQTAKAKGGGVETEAHYPQWRRIHRAIERYYVLQESLVKLIEGCTDTGGSMDKWISRLDSCNWLNHVKDVLTTACLAAQCIDREGASVLVHGSEGIDCTLQVTSIAQIILDPDCRTVRGFEALVEREWLQAGHPFADRCSKSAFSVSKPRFEGPVFLLFLDCVWQIYQQFPCSFEFNEQFLIYLFDHSYASQFGTFLCNNEADRKKVKLSTKTVSLWSYINRPEILQTFLNPLYEKNTSVIWPSVAPQSLLLWSGLYLKHMVNQSAYNQAWNEIVRIKQRDSDLQLRAVRLRKQLMELQKEAVQKNLIVDDE
ncbi:myotubularin-related protein 9 [Saccoglossus kowalevskii]|uniref:Myotubularin-related protein 9 n=1 Tax=Saccoglossus kowalevskii TaxID=10224 RepID=A0ABM0H1F3_SACKO|nr:PREDICTED: myotubularin-related protein 9 [Saccoglossus kowalevskii]